MPQIVIPKEFYIKELQVYPTPALAFWRENFSNALDAGANEIRINIHPEDENGNYLVTFTDNGCGMTRTVLDTVFFRLGATTKDAGGSATGGFGRARILTLFAHVSYEILTLDNYVSGDGGDYEITSGLSPFSGTEFRVTVNSKLWPRTHLARMLRLFLEECGELPAKVFYDGIEQNWSPVNGRWIRDLSYAGKIFARVYHRKPPVPHGDKIVVRVNGTAMFNRALSAPGWVIIDLIPETSREVMTANRDGFNSEYQAILTRLQLEFASEKKTAFKPRPPRENRLYEGTGFLFATDSVSDADSGRIAESRLAALREAVGRSGDYSPSRRVAASPRDFAAILKAERDAIFAAIEAQVLSAPITGFEEQPFEETAYPSPKRLTATAETNAKGETVYRAEDFLPDIPLVVESSFPKVLDAAATFNPKNWKFRVLGSTVVWENYDDEVLLYFTVRLIAKAMIDVLIARKLLRSVSYAVGFLFSEDKLGELVDHPKGKMILINPVKENGTLRYKAHRRSDLMPLISVVAHEVAHVVESLHDESYASVLTDLFGACRPWSLEAEIKALT